MKARKYFNKLVEIVDGYGYENLLRHLYSEEFIVKVKTDVNLIQDVRYLREKCDWPVTSPPTVLEILICIARNMDDILYDSKHDSRLREWFWLMLENMGLTMYTNPAYDENAVTTIVDIFNNRRYRVTGEGGPFPLKHPPKNMRKVDYWYQVNYYVNENFSYEFDNLEEDINE